LRARIDRTVAPSPDHAFIQYLNILIFQLYRLLENRRSGLEKSSRFLYKGKMIPSMIVIPID